MAYHAPSVCPVCGKGMHVTHLSCGVCGSELSGQFSPCRYCALPEKDLRFLETFLRCRGSIKDMERELGISYPTVRNQLDQLLRALALDGVSQAESDAQDSVRSAVEGALHEARRAVLDALAQGKLAAREAAEQLRKLKDEFRRP